MDGTCKDLLDVCDILYLDDVSIYSENSIGYKKYIREVLRRPRDNSYPLAKLDKCELNGDTTDSLLALTASVCTNQRSQSSKTG